MNESVLPVSVTICAYNEAQDIADCLDKVVANHPAEIIVVDAGSTDDTVFVAESKGATVIRYGKKGLSSQRQAGLDAVSQPYTAIIDADDHIGPEFLKTLLEQIDEYDYDALGGRHVSAYEPVTYWQKAMGSSGAVITHTDKPTDTNMVGRPAMYRTDSLRVCGFDSYFDGAGNEDADLSIRMEMSGFRQGIGTGEYRRRHTASFSEMIKKFRKYGRGDARIIYKYPFKTMGVFYHLAIRYPVIRGLQVIVRGDGIYLPFYLLHGWVRLFALFPELLRLVMIRPVYKPYDTEGRI
jgi:glycosyltransferase involved in cell wall biosynthesis